MFSRSAWDNISQGNYLYNVNPKLTDTFVRKITYTNIVYIMLEEHCIGMSSSQSRLNTFETTLHQKIILCNVGPELTVIFSQENELYNVFLICLCQHSKRKLPARCCSTVHKQLWSLLSESV